jgi:hypothetical protein
MLPYRSLNGMVKVEYRFGTRLVALCGIPTSVLLIWCLEKFKYTPYRPPMDMSPLLTPDLQAIVTLIQVFVGIIFVFCGWAIYRWIRPKTIEISD